MSAITLSKNSCGVLQRRMTIKSQQGLSVVLPRSRTSPSSLGFSRTIISKPLVLSSSSKCFRKTSMAVYKVKLIDPDGKEQEVEAPDDAYILDSAEVAGLGLPCSCRAGTCSYCTARIESGSVDQSEGYFLDDSQKEKGYILTCISYPTSDCVIHTHKESELYS